MRLPRASDAGPSAELLALVVRCRVALAWKVQPRHAALAGRQAAPELGRIAVFVFVVGAVVAAVAAMLASGRTRSVVIDRLWLWIQGSV